MTLKVDVQSLVDDGHLSIERIFSQAIWKTIKSVGVFAYKDSDSEFQIAEVVLQQADEYGIRAYRWTLPNGWPNPEVQQVVSVAAPVRPTYPTGLVETVTGSPPAGTPTLARSEAESDALDWVEALDQTPDIDDSITGILASQWFGPNCEQADVDRILGWLSGDYSSGYVYLLPGDVPTTPNWSAQPYYMKCPHISMAARHPTRGLAACHLLSSIEAWEG